MTIYQQTAADADLGRPSARKSGRNPRWPYVPIIITNDGVMDHETQVLGMAYEDRDLAVKAAERQIAHTRARIARQLAEPRYRALREHYGLPRELEDSECTR